MYFYFFSCNKFCHVPFLRTIWKISGTVWKVSALPLASICSSGRQRVLRCLLYVLEAWQMGYQAHPHHLKHNKQTAAGRGLGCALADLGWQPPTLWLRWCVRCHQRDSGTSHIAPPVVVVALGCRLGGGRQQILCRMLTLWLRWCVCVFLASGYVVGYCNAWDTNL
jgi:hypothetical protein